MSKLSTTGVLSFGGRVRGFVLAIGQKHAGKCRRTDLMANTVPSG